jgi:hypothetical protein
MTHPHRQDVKFMGTPLKIQHLKFGVLRLASYILLPLVSRRSLAPTVFDKFVSSVSLLSYEVILKIRCLFRRHIMIGIVCMWAGSFFA